MGIRAVRVGLIGCGDISGIYLRNARQLEAIEVVACADLAVDRAQSAAAEFGIPRAGTVAELLADPEVELVLNLTTPAAHAEVGLAALQAGKSLYNEKPLAITREDARRLLDTARRSGLRIGCAPDTFLGGGLQTARQLIDEGAIGQPVAATGFMISHGPESWHPAPEFFYRVGGGPLFDMGPYYLTALINLFGPVRRVSGAARATFTERTITSKPKCGRKIAVETPTHVAGMLEFAGGAIASLIMTFDVWHAELPFIEVYGADGSLSLPDPNTFSGPLRLRRASDRRWREVPLRFGYTDNSRGLGPADLAHALRCGRGHRASGELAYHVLDVMHAILESAQGGRHVELQSTCQRPAPLPAGLPPGTLDG